MNYQKFAHVYDQVMDQQLYEEWTDYAVRSFSHSAKRPVRKVMELACGTGEVSMRLDDKGYEVIGVDLSKNMLEIAEKKLKVDLSNGFKLICACWKMYQRPMP